MVTCGSGSREGSCLIVEILLKQSCQAGGLNATCSPLHPDTVGMPKVHIDWNDAEKKSQKHVGLNIGCNR